MKSLTALILFGYAAVTQAQSVCSSDEQVAPTALAERFISAECEDCWNHPEARQAMASSDTLVLDWIVPSPRGEDAPLSAAATRDALVRLEMLHAPAPASWTPQQQRVNSKDATSLRVARGPALANYVGTSIALTPASGGPWTAVLLLVEQIPVGSEGTPIARNLVRNMLITTWDETPASSPTEPQPFFESRPMSLPEGTQADRVQTVGWVQDAQGRLVALVRSACEKLPTH